MSLVEFRLFGEVEAVFRGAGLSLGHARQRCVLALLLVEVNRVVPVPALLDGVWGENLPDTARVTLRSYLSRLRAALAPAGVTITRAGAGYRLTAPARTVDLHAFRTLVAAARSAEDPLPLLEQALALWRGDEPFAGLTAPGLDGLRALLVQERRCVELDRVDLLLDRGRHNELLPELVTAAAAAPLDERRAGQLMLAQYRLGRQADALTHYAGLRTSLAEELGVDPSPRLRELYQRILIAAPELTPAARTAPAQLPAPPRLFTGRATELARLSGVLARGNAATVSAVGGMGGVGKTALVLHWAHANLAAFPDGQLHVDLHGFDPAAPPMAPAIALRGFLDALGVPATAVPVDEHAQAALYRSLVAGRRLLIVLDNARDSEQVLPLLPGSSMCTVVITSRHRLDGLLATHGVHPLPMDVLTEPDAKDLLVRFLGADRVAAEPQAVADLLDRCARLPLALGIVAARAATHPGFPLSALAEELREGGTRLDTLDSGELTANLRAVFATTYRALSPDAVTLAGLLALAPGPDLGLPAAAVLADVAESSARALLRELAALHLVQEQTPGRYRMHDLVRLYAAEHAGAADDALRRLLTHYQDLVEHFASPALLPEVGNLVAATTFAADQGWLSRLPALAGRVPRMLDAFGHYDAALDLARFILDIGDPDLAAEASFCLGLTHWRLGHTAQAITHYERALGHAKAAGDRLAEAEALNGLGLAHWRLSDFEQARAEHEEALTIGRDLDDAYTQGYAHLGAGYVSHWVEDYARALDHHWAACEIARAAGGIGSLEWQALNGVGLALVRLGRAEDGRQRLAESLDLSRAAGDPYTTVSNLFCLGFALQALGELTAAAEHHRRSLALASEIGEQLHQARTHHCLGTIHDQLGEHDRAASHHARARVFAEQLGLPADETSTRWAVEPPD
ncbi:AfsR/SARP family transcriptional regulator [Allokutzneria oryzae]|uniref:BTAD domain-containing putative transcriptional regulator n=1 Tax=Allokutzneria oryzae TaxID=1378989 RepID=A0ABV5ZTK0_9PSEU